MSEHLPLVQRLRAWYRSDYWGPNGCPSMVLDAADTIERLEERLEDRIVEAEEARAASKDALDKVERLTRERSEWESLAAALQTQSANFSAENMRLRAALERIARREDEEREMGVIAREALRGATEDKV